MPGIPGDMGALGETMRCYLNLRRFGDRSTARGIDSPSTRYQVGMPSSPLTFHPCSGRLGSMYIVGVLTRGPDRISVG